MGSIFLAWTVPNIYFCLILAQPEPGLIMPVSVYRVRKVLARAGT